MAHGYHSNFKNAILKICKIPTLCLFKYICCIICHKLSDHQNTCFEHKTKTIKETNHCNLIATISLYKIIMMENANESEKECN